MAKLQEMMFQNQLQFNLNVPLTTSHLSTHFHRPQPIVVERFNSDSAMQPHRFPMMQMMHNKSLQQNRINQDISPTESFKFSVVSEDKLAAAVQLAKRDLKNNKLQQKAEKILNDNKRNTSPEMKMKENKIYGQKYWERLKNGKSGASKKGQISSAGKMKTKEHDKNRKPWNSSVQTAPISPLRQTFLGNKNADNLPASGHSPPTRDAVGKTRAGHLQNDSIKKLRLEIEALKGQALAAITARDHSPPILKTKSKSRVQNVPDDEIEKFQLEMEAYLKKIESLKRRALSEKSREPLTIEKLGKLSKHPGYSDKDDRKALLRTSVRALLKELEPSENLKHKPDHFQQRNFPSNIFTKKQPVKKGLLLPGKLRVKRQKLLNSVQQRHQFNTHFADPTITANLKASTHLYNPVTEPRSLSAPPSPRGRKKEVNFSMPSEEPKFYASSPGAQRCIKRNQQTSPQQRRSRSHSPVNSDYLSSWSPSAEQQRFFIQDVDQNYINDFFPGEGKKIERLSRKDTSKLTGSLQKNKVLRSADVSDSFIAEVEQRVAQRLKPLLKSEIVGDQNFAVKNGQHTLASAILDDVLNEAVEDLQSIEHEQAARGKAAEVLGNPTMENIHQRLEEMEREHQEIRRRWTTVSYHDTAPGRLFRPQSTDLRRSEQPRDPPALEVTKLYSRSSSKQLRAFPDDLTQEPLLFTKEKLSSRTQFDVHTKNVGDKTLVGAHETLVGTQAVHQQQSSSGMGKPRTLVSMKQTMVERIADAVERFDYYQRGLRHHLGKKEPWQIIENVADQILDECFAQVVAEMEDINMAMADHIYKSEFMDQSGLPLSPPVLASDFITGGPAAQNLRDSAAAKQSVERVMSKTEPSISLNENSRLDSRRESTHHSRHQSPVLNSAVGNVYDVNFLNSSIEDSPPRSPHPKDATVDDTKVDEDEEYDDDYTDFTDEDDESIRS